MWNTNGVLILDLIAKSNYIKNFQYLGINSSHTFPLLGKQDIECIKLTEEQMFNAGECDRFIPLEFISNMDLYERYLTKCSEMNIPIRVLFLESNYINEVWDGSKIKTSFLGYEYCPIPIDEQIITDLDWYSEFECFRKLLNEYGLFNTYEEAEKFKAAYDLEFQKGLIGDGEFEGYIFRVSEVIDERIG